MKKVLSMILALVLCMSLCACGGNDGNNNLPDNQTEEKIPSKDSVIGTWSYTYKATSSGLVNNIGDEMRQNIDLYKGGTGKYHYYNDTKNNEYGNPTLTWEMQDDVINITLADGQIMAFIYDETADTLTRMEYNWTYKRAE